MTGGAFEVGDGFLAIGRTFAEYRRMFELDVANLQERRVLDCGAGAASFAARAAAVGADVTAADPLYGPPAGVLEPELEAAIEANLAQLREKCDLFVWDYYGDVETRGRYLVAAAERFLADYAANPGRYLAAQLPDLPFDEGAFDLALVANLLFLYDDRLDLSFHVAALSELARVAGEVRVFPLASLDRRRSDYVDRVLERLRAEGLETATSAVPYEFQPDATEMLVVSGAGSNAGDRHPRHARRPRKD